MEHPLLPTLAALVAAGGACLALVGVWKLLLPPRSHGRLKLFAGPSIGAIDGSTALAPVSDRLARASLTASFARPLESVVGQVRLGVLRQRLDRAGLTGRTALQRFLIARALLALATVTLLAPISLAALPLIWVPAFALAGSVLGWLTPDLWLRQRTNGRRADMLRTLPDALDLLTIGLGAGLGLTAAMAHTARLAVGPIRDEIALVVRDVGLGRARRDALRDLALRTGLDDVSQLASSVIYAEDVGSPLRDVIRVHAEQLRLRLRQAAEERARK